MAITIGNLLVKLGLNARDFDTGLDQALGKSEKASGGIVSNLSKAGGAFQNLGKAALGGITVATGAIVGLGAGFTAYVSDATIAAARTSELGAVLRLLGDRAGWTGEQITGNVDAMKELGIRTDVAQGLLAQFARYQLDAADATGIARVAQDAAVLSQKDSSEALQDIMHGILTQNSLVLRNAGLNIMASTAMDKYAASIGKTAKDLTETERIQAMLNAVMEEGERVAGAYTTAMEEPGKAARSLARHFYEAKVAIGEAFLPAYGNVINAITDGIKGFRGLLEEGEPVNRLFGSLGEIAEIVTGRIFGMAGSGEELYSVLELIADTAETVVGALESFFTQIDEGATPIEALTGMLRELGFDEVASTIETVVEVIGEVIAAIRSVLDPITTWIGENVKLQDILIVLGAAIASVVVPALISVLSAIAPVIAIFIVAVAIVAALRLAWETNFLGIQDITATVLAWIQQAVENVLTWINQFWITHGETITAAAVNAWAWIQQAIDDALAWIQQAVADVLAWVDSFWQSHGETILGIAQTAWDGIRTHVETTLQFIQAIIDTIMAAIRGDWEGAWMGIHGITDTYLAMIQNLVDTILGVIAGIFGLNAAELKSITDDAWTAIHRTVDTMINAVKVVIEVIAAAIEAFWQTHGETILRIADLAWEAIKNTIDTITKLIYGIYEAFRALFEGDWKGFMTAVLGLWLDLWEGIMRNLGIFGEALRLALGVLWDMIVVGVEQMFRGFLRVVEEWLPKILKIFTKAWEKIKEGAMNAINSVRKTFQDMDWAALGRAIMQGIANGIKAGAQMIIDAASSAARAAFEAAKRVLGIGSPSKLFWDIGANMSSSMALGIERLIGRVEVAASRLATAAIGQTQSTITAPTVQQSASPEPGGGPIYNYYLTNTFARPDDPQRIEHVIRGLEATHA